MFVHSYLIVHNYNTCFLVFIEYIIGNHTVKQVVYFLNHIIINELGGDF